MLIKADAPDRSQLSATGASVWRLLAGQEPTAVAYPGPWLEVNGWHLAVAIDVLVVISAVVAIAMLRRPPRGRRAIAVVALTVDAVVATFLLAYVLHAMGPPLVATGLPPEPDEVTEWPHRGHRARLDP